MEYKLIGIVKIQFCNNICINFTCTLLLGLQNLALYALNLISEHIFEDLNNNIRNCIQNPHFNPSTQIQNFVRDVDEFNKKKERQ